MSKHNYNNYSKQKSKLEPEEKPVVQEAEPFCWAPHEHSVWRSYLILP